MYRFVIADDEPFIMQMLLKVIDWEHFNFTCAASFTDGRDALNYLKENTVDLFITDIRMPGVSGLEIAKYLHTHSADTRVVLISAYQDFQHAVTAIEYNVKAYLIKPIVVAKLKKELLKIKMELDKNSSEMQNEAKTKSVIDRVEEYIKKNYKNNITLEELADYVDLSPSYLSHLFSQKTNTTFSDYLIKIRMDKAQKLLKDPHLKVYDVCEMVGYKNLSYFHQLFKKYTGVTPNEYRRNKTESKT